MRGMNDPADPREFAPNPTTKERSAVLRTVTALLDVLAPERELRRGDPARPAIAEYRTPSGCVLQAATAALSVSYFTDTESAAPLGELHLVVWRGVVTRRGAPRVKEHATQVKELVLYPMTSITDKVWRAADGTEYSTTELAAKCTELLEEQIAS